VGNPKRLLILNRTQFGYHPATYSCCRWAHADFQITYHGFDLGKPKLDPNGVAVHYVPRRGGLVRRYVRFLGSCLAECGRDYDVIFVRYFPGCLLLRLCHPRRRFVLDIRTGSIAPNPLTRWAQDLLLRLESRGFRHVTIISASLARKLGLAQVHLLPPGAEPVATPPKDFSVLHLLYVGTFHGRRLEDTLTAFHQFYREYGHAVAMTYDIIGDGSNGARGRLRMWAQNHGLADVVSLPGFLPHGELTRYYEKCNVGVSYIPINSIYDCQPPTKTFEYLLAGLPVIATNTSENAAVITEHNGLLIADTPAAFCEALRQLVTLRDGYSSDRIRRDALKYSWETIVRSHLVPFLNSLVDP
jgi:glycosyltransferase involved in cell wall biosynthesis